MKQSERLPVVVLISGSGSNLQALIDQAEKDLPIQLKAVISNCADAYGLTRAAKAGIETAVLDHRSYPDRISYDQALQSLIDQFQPELLVLAGFMRILTPEFVAHYRGHLLNIHPSLLPKFRGLHTHQRALEAKETEHGASVHFVTEDLDAGPLIIQVKVPIEAEDDADRLAARVLTQEHIIYPLVVRWCAEKRLCLRGNQVMLDGHPLAEPVRLAYQG